jgi:hypothetical protein
VSNFPRFVLCLFFLRILDFVLRLTLFSALVQTDEAVSAGSGAKELSLQAAGMVSTKMLITVLIIPSRQAGNL